MFETLPKVLSKNNDSFGNMLDTINYYMTYGRDQLVSTHQLHLQTIAQMAETALFTKKPNVIIKNTEGAILIQLLLQIMRGSDACNSFFEPLLNRVKQRMSQTPISPLLKKHILGIYLSALIYNKGATLMYLE